jgi:hypothetical protein
MPSDLSCGTPHQSGIVMSRPYLAKKGTFLKT